MHVMLYETVLVDILAMEKTLKQASFEVSKASNLVGFWEKLRYADPDVLVFDPFIDGFDEDDFFEHLGEIEELKDLVLVVCSRAEPMKAHEYCLVHDLHGYITKSSEFGGLVKFLEGFFKD